MVYINTKEHEPLPGSEYPQPSWIFLNLCLEAGMKTYVDRFFDDFSITELPAAHRRYNAHLWESYNTGNFSSSMLWEECSGAKGVWIDIYEKASGGLQILESALKGDPEEGYSSYMLKIIEKDVFFSQETKKQIVALYHQQATRTLQGRNPYNCILSPELNLEKIKDDISRHSVDLVRAEAFPLEPKQLAQEVERLFKKVAEEVQQLNLDKETLRKPTLPQKPRN